MIEVLSRKVYAANAPRLLWRRSMEGRLILWPRGTVSFAMTLAVDVPHAVVVHVHGAHP